MPFPWQLLVVEPACRGGAGAGPAKVLVLYFFIQGLDQRHFCNDYGYSMFSIMLSTPLYMQNIFYNPPLPQITELNSQDSCKEKAKLHLEEDGSWHVGVSSGLQR